MADEKQTFRVYFKSGHSIVIRIHSFKKESGHVTFYKAQGQTDTDIWVSASETLAIVPEVEAPEVAAGNVTRSSSGVRSR
jgi:hypothetical protein